MTDVVPSGVLWSKFSTGKKGKTSWHIVASLDETMCGRAITTSDNRPDYPAGEKSCESCLRAWAKKMAAING